MLVLLRVMFSANPQAGIYGLAKLVELVFIGIYSAVVIKQVKIRRTLPYLLGTGIVIEVLLSLMQIKNDGSIGGIFYWLGERYFTSQTPGIANAAVNGELLLRPYGTLSHPNILAAWLLLSTLVLLSLVKRKKVVVLFVVVLTVLGVIATMSRTVILVSLFVSMLYLKQHLGQVMSKSKLVISCLLISFTIILIAHTIYPRLFTTSIREESWKERVDLTSSTLKIIVKEPLLGVGVNNFLNVLSIEESDQSASLQPVHNVPLHVITELGVPIGISVLTLYYLLFKRILEGGQSSIFTKRESLIILSVIALLSLTDHYFRTLQQGQLIIASVIGWIYGAHSKKVNRNLRLSKSSKESI